MHALRWIYWDSACFVTGAVGGRCNNARCESLSLSGVETYKRTVYDHSLKHASCKMDPTRPDAILYHARTAGELFKRVRTVPYRALGELSFPRTHNARMAVQLPWRYRPWSSVYILLSRHARLRRCGVSFRGHFSKSSAAPRQPRMLHGRRCAVVWRTSLRSCDHHSQRDGGRVD